VTLDVRRSHNASRDPRVVDAAPARALEEGERPVVGIKHHLLRLARIAVLTLTMMVAPSASAGRFERF
jgi:hypothetical protein